MNTRNLYSRPFIKILHIDLEPILGVGTDANVHIKQIVEGDASTAQTKFFGEYEDYSQKMDDDNL